MENSRFSDLDAQAYRSAYLIAGFIRGTLTDNEHVELDNWVNENDQNMQLFEEFTDEENLSANLQRLDEKLQSESLPNPEIIYKVAETAAGRKLLLRPVAWAMMVLVVVSIGGLYFFYRQKSATPKPVTMTNPNKDYERGTAAVQLTLMNGKVIRFPDEANENEKTVESVVVRKDSNNFWTCTFENLSDSNEQFTLEVPPGKQFNLRLSDGTKVWLNTATTFKFPAIFLNTVRKVKLKGEAYLEVAENKHNPFEVATAKSTIHVLGTSFNVNAYTEGSEEISLFKGSVDVSNGSEHQRLDPGTTAHVSAGGVAKHKNEDSEEILGWKQKKFIFKNAPIRKIMLEISRWYNIKVSFKKENNHLFNAEISRNEPLQRVLNLLQLNGNVRFKLNGNLIEVF